MEIRKEQALLVGSLAILALLYMNSDALKLSLSAPRGTQTKLQDIGETAQVLLDGGETKFSNLKRDLFVEPSDISVLPPLEAPELVLPPLPAFPIVVPILKLGEDSDYWYRQRLSLARIRELGSGKAAPTPGGTIPDPPAAGQGGVVQLDDVDPQAEKEKAWAKQYDMVIYKGSKHWGKILNKNAFRLGRPHNDSVLHLLELEGPFARNREIHYKKMNPEKGSVSIPDFKIAGEDLAGISLIRFADTVSNIIGMKRIRLPAGEIGLPDREAFILEMLTKYRDYPEAFQAAEEQAKFYIENNLASSRGHELLCLVYSISGQLEKELAKYQELMQGKFRTESFIYRGLGTLEARLGMDEAAEEHLKQAVRLVESDAKARFALARFYRQRSRGNEALVQAERAVKNMGPKLKKEEAFAVSSLYVACLLGQGMVEEAKTALLQAGNHLTGQPEDSPAYNLLLGSVKYAEGEFDDAAMAFATAAQGMSDPILPATGQAMAQFRAGRIADSFSAAESGLTRDPLERHRALTVKGFLHGSAQQIDEAVETFRLAQGMAPRAPYSLYILGHWLSQEGRFDEAEEVLEDVLSRHSEIVEVMAEYALMLVRMAKAAGFSAEGHGHLIRAERYAKKVCEMEKSRAKLWVYQDLLGVIRYFLRNNDGSRSAFNQAVEWAPLEEQAHSKIYLTLLDYRDGKTDVTLHSLNNIRELVKSENPLHAYIGKLIEAIKRNANLRVFRTDFSLPGKVSKDFNESKGQPRWRKTNGEVWLDGKSMGQAVWLRKTLPGGAAKLDEVSVKLRVGAEFSGNRAFFRITDLPIKQGVRKTSSSYQYVLGYERGLRLLMTEGGPEKKPIVDKREARGDFASEGVSFKPGETHTLGFRVERGEQGVRQATLVVFLDGQEIDRANVNVFSFGRGRDLHLDLWVEGDKSSRLQMAFDDFEMKWLN